MMEKLDKIKSAGKKISLAGMLNELNELFIKVEFPFGDIVSSQTIPQSIAKYIKLYGLPCDAGALLEYVQ